MYNVVKKDIRNNIKAKIYEKASNIKTYLEKEDGMGVVEVILIVVVLVGLVFVFKDKMTSIVSNMFTSITDGITKVTN